MDKISKADGGPAFPLVRSPVGLPDKQHWGMTLRDYFAAQVLSTLINKNPNAVKSDGAEAYTENAYAWADLMIISRDG